VKTMNRIEKFYDNNPHKEKTRLTRSAYDTIESEITRRFLSKHLKPQSRIAEIGCGAGHYSTWLLKNHKVHLVDLSSELLKLAESEIEKSQLNANVLGVSKSDARDLKGLEDGTFDATLVMGPLYHLINEEDRIKCLAEANRITKKGGLILSAIINRVCPFLNMMHMHTEQLALELSEDTEEMQRILTSGQYENFEENPNNFTDAYFSNIHEVPQYYKNLGIELVESFACEGLASYLYDKAEVIKQNEKAWARFIDLIYENANKPELLGMSEHVVFVGRKT
jgi:ubiquinone/menaquinone biosynthesis C-methylase UbiE